MLSNSLPDAGDARDRSWAYSEAPAGSQFDGTLAINETVGVRVVKHLCRVYAVEEQASVGYIGRVFLLAKLAHKGDPNTKAGQAGMERTGEVYETRVGADGSTACTCTAGHTHKRCVHAAVMADACRLGLPDPRDSGCDRVPESREYAAPCSDDECDRIERECQERSARVKALLAETAEVFARTAALIRPE